MNDHRSQQVLIRRATPEDAEAMIAYVRELSEELDIDILLGPGEFTLTVPEEQAFIAACAESDNSLFLIAEERDEIIGALICQGGKRRAIHHVSTLGISIKRSRRGQGVGTQLMNEAVAWARASSVVRRLELDVFVRNQRAIALYERFGFVIEGCRRAAIYRGGEYLDDLVMGLLIG